jgi:hypothetical protein
MAEIIHHLDDPSIWAEVIDCGDGGTLLRYNDGTEIKSRGFGSMKDKPLDLDPRIDLTKPIYEQAMKLWHEDDLQEQNANSGEAA